MLLPVVFFLAHPVQARDARSVGDWLCKRIFEGPGIALALACDGFFGLRINQDNLPQQDITGLWRLSADGVDLVLYNLQDQHLQLTVGRSAIHGSLGGRQATLLPGRIPSATFAITGLLEKKPGLTQLSDAASGRVFTVNQAPDAASGKFATANVTIANGQATGGEVLSHSAVVPRSFERAPQESDPQTFLNSVANKYWLLPPLPNVEKAALRLAAPKQGSGGQLTGTFEIVGPGLRLEGTYSLAGSKLTLKTTHANLRNLKFMGAESLAQSALGEFTWRLLPRGLELVGASRLLLLAN